MDFEWANEFKQNKTLECMCIIKMKFDLTTTIRYRHLSASSYERKRKHVFTGLANFLGHWPT